MSLVRSLLSHREAATFVIAPDPINIRYANPCEWKQGHQSELYIYLSLTQPPVAPYQLPPTTNEKLEWADIATIDLSKAATPEGQAELAILVRDAMTSHGFFYVVNYGLDPVQLQRMMDIADVPFSCVTDEEKALYAGKIKEEGTYDGYKLRQYWHIDGGVRDQIEQYNMHFDLSKRSHPTALRPFLPEVQEVIKFLHFDLLHPLLRLFAKGLGLSEETLVNIHQFDAVGDTFARFMKYYPRTKEDEEKSKNVWLKGHTDLGTTTILFSQPISALQILWENPDGKREWKWIKHIDNALVINAGKGLEYLSGGIYKATIHRVVQPPVDQRQFQRLGIYYFGTTDDDVLLNPLPGLIGAQASSDFKNGQAPTMEMWRKGRISNYGQTDPQAGKEEDVQEEYINGVLVKHYN